MILSKDELDNDLESIRSKDTKGSRPPPAALAAKPPIASTSKSGEFTPPLPE